MNDTPKTIAAPIAEMLEFCSGWGEDVDVTVKVGLIYGWACRLKEAEEREREDLVDAHDAIARLEDELAEVRRERDTACAKQALSVVPGNVAAMREALVEISQMCGVGPNEVSAIAIAHICDKALKTKGE